MAGTLVFSGSDVNRAKDQCSHLAVAYRRGGLHGIGVAD